ncbi:MAG: Holliday junction resolvase RuvX [Candidatus Zixiibacteriota bacterium]
MAVTSRTFLAIDYGVRRIGLAKSDPTGTIASVLATLEVKSDKEAIQHLAGVISNLKPSALVIGYPLNDDGTENDACRRVDAFVAKLSETFDGPIHRVDEFGTSEEAVGIIHAHGKRAGKKKERIDRLAAVIILQRFLDEQK